VELRPTCPKCHTPMMKGARTPGGKVRWTCRKGGKYCYSTTTGAQVLSKLEAAAPMPEAPKIDVVQEHALFRKVRRLEAENKELIARAALESGRAEAFSVADDVKLDPPEWLIHLASNKTNHGTITTFLSDTHFDEVVNPAEVNEVNAYNRDIATLRLRKFFDNSIMLVRDYIAGVKIDGLVLQLGGDMVSGNIHEELERTNDAPILDTCVYWAEQIAAGMEQQLKFFSNIFVPCVTGNHGRMRKRPQYKTRARDNFDWLIYKMLEKHFRGESRITFMIPDGPSARFNVYDKRHHLVHGDEFSGGNGIGGIAVPILRGDALKQKTEVAVGTPYDFMSIGHWHTRCTLGGGSVRINGTTKGYDEFTQGNRLGYQEPQQSLWMNTPERGITVDMPIFVRDKNEKWG